MDTRPSAGMELRILLCTVTVRDAIVAVAVLKRSGMQAIACSSVEALLEEMDRGVGAVLVSEEFLNGTGRTSLTQWLQNQPAWSDVPVLVSARPGIDTLSLGQAFELLSNVTILERPMRIASLVSAARSALRARERQLQLRSHFATLHEMDHRKNEFLATLAHELRNPMAPLTTTLAILRIKSPLPVGSKPYYDVMERQVKHMAKLVDDLMEVSRITRGKIELKRQRIFISSVISDAIEVSRPGIEALHHTLVVDPIDPMLAIDGDPVRLTQVFSNILNNAARYTPERGHIHVTTEKDEANVTVIVRDTGIGIAAHDLPGIFDMFFQVSGTNRVAQGGLGIGLTLVKSLVELHGGNVQAGSAGSGQGSEFKVTLLLIKKAVTAKKHAETNSIQPFKGSETFKGLSVLVVDDNQDAADSLSDLLLLHGAHVDVAHSGPEGLKISRKVMPQVAILDIGMPGMDGYELAQRLVEENDGPKPFLIALTGWGQAEDRARIAAAGFKFHLVKPLKFFELVHALSKVRE